MRTNRVKQLLREGKPTVGTWLVLPDPFAAQLMTQVGFDWLTVEMEHTPTDFETAALMFQLIASGGGVPLVRVPWNTGENVKRVLDCGAWGIIYPMITTVAEAEAAVAAAKYPPEGFRAVGGSLHAVSFGTNNDTYLERANDEVLVVIQIEHIRAVERAEEILSVPGVDAVFIGPSDLTASMRKSPGDKVPDADLQDAIRHVCQTATRLGVAPGLHVFTPEAAIQRIEEGFRFIAIGTETRFMTAGASSALTRIRAGKV